MKSNYEELDFIMNSSQTIQQILYHWCQKNTWNLHTYEPEIVGKIFYDRGHYLSAFRWLKLAGSPEKFDDIPFQLDDLNTSVQKFLECHRSMTFSYQKHWLAITEEALSYFTTRSDHLNAGDAYQILRTSLCSFVNLPKKTADRVTICLSEIENSPEWIGQILAKRSRIRLNIHFIHELMMKLWDNPLISQDLLRSASQTSQERPVGTCTCRSVRGDLKDPLRTFQLPKDKKYRVAYDYLNEVEYTFDVKSEHQHLMLLALYNNRELFPPEDQAKIQLYVGDLSVSDPDSYPIPTDKLEENLRALQKTLTNRDLLVCQWIRVKIAIEKHVNNLSDVEIAMILREVISLERIYHSCHFFEVHLDQEQATIELVRMRLENRTDLITDVEAIKYLKELKRFGCSDYTVLPLMEKFYLQGRASSYQRLTIANNTCSNLTFKVSVSGKVEEFTLRETQQRRYDNLREKGITHVGVVVIRDGKIIVEQPYLDANSYVACYGDFKFTVYFEPDVSAESEIPTSEMIRQVADLLQHEYLDYRRSYPRSDFNDFIGGLGCDLNPEHRSRDFTRLLHGLMRPKQLATAIKMILEGEI